MNNGFTKRLAAAVEEIKYPTVADIGCDHAYAAIYAVLTGRAERAYACDINEGPLARAAKNIDEYGLGGKIATLLGDGLAPLAGTDVGTVMICGLGGRLTTEILSNGLERAPGLKQLILQPMSEIPKVRRFIHKIGYKISNERIVRENRKFYMILSCEPGGEEPYVDAEYEFGKILIRDATDVFLEYIRREREKTLAIMDGIAREPGAGSAAKRRGREMKKRYEMTGKILIARDNTRTLVD